MSQTTNDRTGDQGSDETLWFGPGHEPADPTRPRQTQTQQTQTQTQPDYAQAAYAQPAYAQPELAQPDQTRTDPAAGTHPDTAPIGTAYQSASQPPLGPPPAPPQPAGPPPARSRRRWVDVVLAGVVAAVVAGGTTAGVLATDDQNPAATGLTSSSQAAGTGAGPVTQNGNAIDWGSVAGAVEPSVVAISISSQSGSGQGSGVVLDTAGRVLTNNHVASAAGQGGSLKVTLSDGRSYDATIVGTDPSTDLAVIQMKGATNLTPAKLGDSDAVEVGQSVMAVGNPLGLAGTVTTGIVSALDRPVTTSASETDQGAAAGGGDPVVTNAIQTDAAVNPGNSGGALVDTSGRVIGIPSSIASLGQSMSGAQSGSIGLGFSIPINEAKSIADQLIADGKAEHPFLGVTLNDGEVKQGSATRVAAVVQTVSSGTPAATAGLQKGDAVTAVNGELVNGTESLVAQIRERSVGDKVQITLMRGGSEKQVTVTLTSRPAGQ